MIIPVPTPFRRRRQTVYAPPVLTLVSAVYQDSPTQWITLSFSQPINISHIAGTQILVNDAEINGALFEANGSATLTDPNTVRIRLNVIDDSTGTGIQLNASAGNGIVASGDGSPWAGVEGVPLPYP